MKQLDKCIDVDECAWSITPCLNDGICTNKNTTEMYHCDCLLGFSGKDCEVEVLPSATITTSAEFLLTICVCVFVLLSKSIFCLFS